MQLRAWAINLALVLPLSGLAACDDRSKELSAEVAALRGELQQVGRQAQHADDYIAISNLQRAYGYYDDGAVHDVSRRVHPAVPLSQSGNRQAVRVTGVKT